MLLQAFALGGALVSLYALWTEQELAAAAAAGLDYEPLCDIKGFASCSTVLNSEYSYPLSSFGIVPRGHALDVSNAFAGLLWYLLASVHASLPVIGHPQAFLALSVASLGYSVYLFYILKFVLKDMCIVCVSMYIANVGIFVAAARRVTVPLTRTRAEKAAATRSSDDDGPASEPASVDGHSRRKGKGV
jgi:vitamin-K-epoxide reductase (warfarin-sensitive)